MKRLGWNQVWKYSILSVLVSGIPLYLLRSTYALPFLIFLRVSFLLLAELPILMGIRFLHDLELLCGKRKTRLLSWTIFLLYAGLWWVLCVWKEDLFIALCGFSGVSSVYTVNGIRIVVPLMFPLILAVTLLILTRVYRRYTSRSPDCR